MPSIVATWLVRMVLGGFLPQFALNRLALRVSPQGGRWAAPPPINPRQIA